MAMNADSSIPLYLFAKAPVPGQVKTRLTPALTPDHAAAVATLFLMDSMETLASHWPGRVILTVTPDSGHRVFQDMIRQHGIEWQSQVQGDLGQRLLAALSHGVHHHGRAAVMGCDIPHLPGEILTMAHSLMLEGRAVIGPAKDGGFYFLGVAQVGPQLFAGVDWGGEAVFEQIMANFAACGIEPAVLPVVRDIDTPGDLQWLATRDKRYRQFVK